jgi:hypothetical protein
MSREDAAKHPAREALPARHARPDPKVVELEKKPVGTPKRRPVRNAQLKLD